MSKFIRNIFKNINENSQILINIALILSDKNGVDLDVHLLLNNRDFFSSKQEKLPTVSLPQNEGRKNI